MSSSNRGGRAALIAASSAMLSWVALFNRYPLVFPDTISYASAALLGEVPGMFSIYYSVFILPLHQGLTLWPVVFVQGAILAHLLHLVTRCVFAGIVTTTQTLLIIAFLCVFSSLPWFTAQIMPDVFSSVVVLAVFLLAFCPDQLTQRERMYASALLGAGIVTHLSHVPIALGLIMLCLVLRQIFVTTEMEIRRWAALLLVPFSLAVCSMLATNWVHTRQIAFARNSNVFLLAKWIEEGPALAYLQQACPGARYSLCPYLHELRGVDQDGLKWSRGSPFYKVGGFDQLEPEARRIVWATVRSYPVDILQRAFMNLGRQLLQFGIGEGLSPGAVKLVVLHLAEVFGPDVIASLSASRQAQGRLPVTEFRQLHLFALVSTLLLALVWSMFGARKRMPARAVALYVFVSLAILWNAIVASALSGPFDRYLARISWLICFIALVGSVYVAARSYAPADERPA